MFLCLVSCLHSYLLFFQHRWRVGIMTEMAPVGYVGVSPKCILGFNKVNKLFSYSTSINIYHEATFVFWELLPIQNMGEEISLRLRTDDLKGFRKYESIKKTLLHELVSLLVLLFHKFNILMQITFLTIITCFYIFHLYIYWFQAHMVHSEHDAHFFALNKQVILWLPL
jgi:hypothetical protein